MSSRALSWSAALTLVALTGCSSVVKISDDDGAGGSGGSGGAAAGPGSGPAQGATAGQTGAAQTGTSGTASATSGQSGASVVASSGTGPSSVQSGSAASGMTCDQIGDCQACAECSVFGGPCTGLYNQCFGDFECSAYVDCISMCGNDPDCWQLCSEQYPMGAALYKSLILCIVCNDCYFSCDGAEWCVEAF